MYCRIAGVGLTVADGINDRFWRLAEAGSWEPDTFKTFKRWLSPETTVLDIGAWIGPTALFAAHHAKKVYAFEPDPVARAELEWNVCGNSLDDKIEIVPACVTTHGQSVRLQVVGDAGNSMSSIAFGDGGWDVPSVTLAGFLKEKDVQDPVFLKVDVEGYEFSLVRDLAAVLLERRAILHLSTHAPIVAFHRWPGRSPFARAARGLTAIWLMAEVVTRCRGLRLESANGEAMSVQDILMRTATRQKLPDLVIYAA